MIVVRSVKVNEVPEVRADRLACSIARPGLHAATDYTLRLITSANDCTENSRENLFANHSC